MNLWSIQVSTGKYGSIGKGSLVISEVRKTEKAQEEEKASIEASKSKEEERKASSQEKKQEQASSHTTTTPTQSNLRPFKNCMEARKAGRVNIPASDPQYGPWLDRDKNGYGCDE